jgi:hypothetical protein
MPGLRTRSAGGLGKKQFFGKAQSSLCLPGSRVPVSRVSGRQLLSTILIQLLTKSRLSLKRKQLWCGIGLQDSSPWASPEASASRNQPRQIWALGQLIRKPLHCTNSQLIRCKNRATLT